VPAGEGRSGLIGIRRSQQGARYSGAFYHNWPVWKGISGVCVLIVPLSRIRSGGCPAVIDRKSELSDLTVNQVRF
jgi:hypothetical protein